MNRLKLLFAALLVAIVSGCNRNENFPYFEDFYVAFDLSRSSVASVNELGSSSGSYYVHYCGEMGEGETITVTFSVTPGDGLQEGVDYRMVTQGNTLTFMPGVYNMPIHVRWLPHALDPSKDNTLTIRLESADKDLVLGLPGPDALCREFKITKFVNE